MVEAHGRAGTRKGDVDFSIGMGSVMVVVLTGGDRQVEGPKATLACCPVLGAGEHLGG